MLAVDQQADETHPEMEVRAQETQSVQCRAQWLPVLAVPTVTAAKAAKAVQAAQAKLR
jgi:hypothetical protein